MGKAVSRPKALTSVRGKTARASPLLKQALVYSGRGNYVRAEVCLRKALRCAPNSAGLFIDGRPTLWNELGMVCKYLGKLDSAERCYRLALRHTRRCAEIAEREFFLANLYHNLGGVEHSRRRFSLAEKYARRGLQLRMKCAAPNSLAVASDLAALAAVLDALHRHKQSEKYYRQALRTYRGEYGDSHPEIAVVLNNLGALYQATGRPKRAESYYRSALSMKRRELGASHPDVAVTMNNLGMFHKSQNRPDLARSWLAKALYLLDSTLGSSHPTSNAVRRNYQRLNGS